jgi:hypothetical protein
MAPSSISIVLAVEADAPVLSSIMNSAFTSRDAAFPLIWDGTPDGFCDYITIKSLFNPVQKRDRVTYKAVTTTESGEEETIGFATWGLARNQEEVEKLMEAKGKGAGVPDLQGVNMGLWSAKLEGPMENFFRDVDPGKDMGEFL